MAATPTSLPTLSLPPGALACVGVLARAVGPGGCRCRPSAAVQDTPLRIDADAGAGATAGDVDAGASLRVEDGGAGSLPTGPERTDAPCEEAVARVELPDGGAYARTCVGREEQGMDGEACAPRRTALQRQPPGPPAPPQVFGALAAVVTHPSGAALVVDGSDTGMEPCGRRFGGEHILYDVVREAARPLVVTARFATPVVDGERLWSLPSEGAGALVRGTATLRCPAGSPCTAKVAGVTRAPQALSQKTCDEGQAGAARRWSARREADTMGASRSSEGAPWRPSSRRRRSSRPTTR